MPETHDDFSKRLQEQLARPTPRMADSNGNGNGTNGAHNGTHPAVAPPRSMDSSPADNGSADPFASRLADATRKANPYASPAPETDEPGARPAETPRDRGPVGTGRHHVRQGECLRSIAHESGHLWSTIWDDGENTELREARKDPHVLLPEDRLAIPPIRRKQEAGHTELRHRFQKKGQPARLNVRVLEDDEPRRNEPYTLIVDGKEFQGVTDADGRVIQAISPRASRGVLHVGEGDEALAYELTLGALDPISEMTGVQGRLNGLGFDCGPIDGIFGERTTDLREIRDEDGDKQTARVRTHPALAIKNKKRDPDGQVADYNSIWREREWIVKRLKGARIAAVFSGHIHRQNLFVLGDVDAKYARTHGYEGAIRIRAVHPNSAATAASPLFVNTTSAGPLGQVRLSRMKPELTVVPGYTEVQVGKNGAILAVNAKTLNNQPRIAPPVKATA